VVVPAPADAGRLTDTLVVVPDVEPVEAVAPDTCVNVNVTLVLGLVLTVAVAVAALLEVFRSFKYVTLLLGLAFRLSRVQTCVPPTQTELMTVLPTRISVMLVPPTAMGIAYVLK